MMDAFLGALESVFSWLLEASAQASVLAALVLLLQWALRGRLNPRWHFALWLLVIARLLLPVLPESTLSLFQFAPSAPVALTRTVTEPIFAGTLERSHAAVQSIAAAPGHPFSVFTGLALVWLVGASGWFVLTWQVNRRFIRHVRRAPGISDPGLLTLAAAAQAELGIHRKLRMIESAQVQSPAMMGLFRPTLILPLRVRARFTDEELRFIFLHEFAHLKRGDLLLQWIIALLQIGHWFNPALWYAFRRMRIDREPATDALVLSRTGEAQKESYGQVLVKLLEHYHARHAPPTLVGILEDQDQFKRRFLLIARFTRGAYGWSLLGVLLIGGLAALGLTERHTMGSEASKSAAPSDVLLYLKFDKLGNGFGLGPLSRKASISDGTKIPATGETLSVWCKNLNERSALLEFIAAKPAGPATKGPDGSVAQPATERRTQQVVPLGRTFSFRIFDAVDVTTSADNAPVESLTVRTFRFPESFKMASREPGDLKRVLIDRGIHFTPDASITYLPGLDKAVVTNTAGELDKIAALIASSPDPSAASGHPAGTLKEAGVVVTGRLRVPGWVQADFAHSSGILESEGSAEYPFKFDSKGQFVVENVAPGEYHHRVQLAWKRGGVPITTKGDFGVVRIGPGNATRDVSWDPTVGLPRKGTVQIAIRLMQIDESIYQSVRAKMDAAIADGNEVALFTIINQTKGASLLSAPSVTTAIGLKAVVDVVREMPYPTHFQDPQLITAAASPSGNAAARGIYLPPVPLDFATKDVGLRTEVTPTLVAEGVSAQGSIILNGKFTVTEFAGFTKSNLVGRGTPTFNISASYFVEALKDGGSRAIWIPGAHFREATNLTPKSPPLDAESDVIKTRLLLILKAGLGKG